MQIHLSRPGGHQEGPYSLEQINAYLASGKLRDTDYWAWHEGLTEWVPLYDVEGVTPPKAAPPTRKPAAPTQPAQVAPKAATAAQPPQPSSPVPLAAEPSPTPAGPTTEVGDPKVASGMPAAALEHIFAFTTGEGQSVMESGITTRMFHDIIGQDFASFYGKVQRDVIARCPFVNQLRTQGSVPESAWRAMTSIKPDLVRQAREGGYRICVRTFPVDNDIVALFLFYRKG